MSMSNWRNSSSSLTKGSFIYDNDNYLFIVKIDEKEIRIHENVLFIYRLKINIKNKPIWG